MLHWDRVRQEFVWGEIVLVVLFLSHGATRGDEFTIDEGFTSLFNGTIVDLDTVRVFPRDFVLRLAFRAQLQANSGLHIRGTKLQVRDDPTVGPEKDLKSFKPGDGNAIEVTVWAGADGKPAVARCTCNGELLEKSLVVPPTGGIGV